MAIERILHENAPSPRGPYSSAVRAGDFIFVSALGPIGEDDKLSPGDIQHQTRLTLNNLVKILAASGAALEAVVKCTVYLVDASEFPQMNDVYSEFFGSIKPARTTIEAKFFQSAQRIGIDCVAYQPQTPHGSPVYPQL
ncbi:MAG: RidA family protein [Bryobacteraceae bacterium]